MGSLMVDGLGVTDQPLRRLEKDFLEQGGLRERMFKARLAHRNRPPQK
jgi:hypothetical protein